MKAKAIIRIMDDLTTCDIGESNIMVNTKERSYCYNPRNNERSNEWDVNEDENILRLTTDNGTAWIDCDAVTSIEI